MDSFIGTIILIMGAKHKHQLLCQTFFYLCSVFIIGLPYCTTIVSAQVHPSSTPTIIDSRGRIASEEKHWAVVDALIKDVVNDPVVHLKYWYWGGHSPDDLAQYIWVKYRNTEWKISIEEAQALKLRAMEILDRFYRKKAEEKFKIGTEKH